MVGFALVVVVGLLLRWWVLGTWVGLWVCGSVVAGSVVAGVFGGNLFGNFGGDSCEELVFVVDGGRWLCGFTREREKKEERKEN